MRKSHREFPKRKLLEFISYLTDSRGANIFPLKLNVNFWQLAGLSWGWIIVAEKNMSPFFKTVF